MSQETNNKRREFLKTSAAGLLGGYVATRILSESTVALANPPVEMVKETDPQAQALGYYSDATKVDTKKWTKRAGPDGATQFCQNCALFQAAGKDPKTLASAPCPIFANKHVSSKGWCNSWAKKA